MENKTNNLPTFDEIYENLSKEEIMEIFSNGDQWNVVMSIEPDLEQGDTDNGPYCGWHYSRFDFEDKDLFVIVGQTDFQHNVSFFDTKEDCDKEWSLILLDALENAYDVGDYEICGCSDMEDLQESIDALKEQLKNYK